MGVPSTEVVLFDLRREGAERIEKELWKRVGCSNETLTEDKSGGNELKDILGVLNEIRDAVCEKGS